MSHMKRILIILHGEEPKGNSVSGIKPRVGLSQQGAVRAHMLPKMISKYFGENPYEIHTYTNCKAGHPVSRSYFTVKSVADNDPNATLQLYPKSESVDELLKGLRNSKSKHILVSWKSTKIPGIIKKLLDVEKPEYDDMENAMDKMISEGSFQKHIVYPKDIAHIEVCDAKYKSQNESAKRKISDRDKEIKHCIVWDLKYFGSKHPDNSYSIFASFMINRDRDADRWIVKDYL